jgi:phenylacetate-CoA ligase
MAEATLTFLMAQALQDRPEPWLEIRDSLARAIVAYATRHCEHYRPFDWDTPLTELPVLTKRALRDHARELRAQGVGDERARAGQSSGSTGVPTTFLKDSASFGADLAGLYALRHLCRIPETSQMMLQTTRSRETMSSPEWVTMEIGGIRPDQVADLFRHWAEHGSYFVYSRASHLWWFLEHIDRVGRPPVIPDAIVATQDTLGGHGAERVRAAFGCPVHRWYGLSEISAFLAGTVDESEEYAFNPLLTVAEVLGEDGRPAAPGETGRLVLTDLHNRVSPLIRYDTGDLAVASDGTFGGWPLVAGIVGRAVEQVRLPDGRALNATDLQAGVFNDDPDAIRAVSAFQCLQRRNGGIELRVRWDGEPRPEIAARLEEKLRNLSGDLVPTAVRAVERLETLPSGKRWVVRREA